MVEFIKNNDQAVFSKNIFQPARLGELTKDNRGQCKNVSDFQMNPLFRNKNSTPVLQLIKNAQDQNESVFEKSAAYTRKIQTSEYSNEYNQSFREISR